MSHPLATELRSTIATLRRKPIALSDFIPLLQRAADEMDRLDWGWSEANSAVLDRDLKIAGHADEIEEMKYRIYEITERLS